MARNPGPRPAHTDGPQQAAGPEARVVVVGAGHGGAALVALLRQGGHRGEIVLIGDEPEHPYQRPPLSKKFTSGELEQVIRPREFYAEQQVVLQLGERVTGLDAAAQKLTTTSGGTFGYDFLVLATGARPRPLPAPGANLDGVAALRTLADARVLRDWLAERRRLVIVGAGYIGLEVAAVATAAGVPVTVLEREERVLNRVASSELSAILTAAHGARGVDIRVDAQVCALAGNGAVREVVLGSGGTLPADGVLVGIGAIPNTELAEAAGLACAGGIVVDETARTSDPAVLAIGDATVRPVAGVGRMRLESIPSATEQAKQAAATILGTPPPAPELPWFWSDQLDLKLKIAGVVLPGREVVLRGDPGIGRFALFHLERGQVRAVETANSPAEFMAGKKLIASGVLVDPVRLADPAVPLRDVSTGAC
ncbi:FAD-dependent oxidoreductase [Pseudonocardia sp. RS11V-5]|uniref:NAD(P)/FAD-dependent oxidoreductase n=1 Tax=Pseudonocardia terrae TaxID=2905831 RepID=UPI001E5AD25D|nr:FAD-dependent oxidoreductase [Pseudonocardia terrae]MCE3551198.1 FAD-dependent oxidoreductase [Pseudonocardia terrae]